MAVSFPNAIAAYNAAARKFTGAPATPTPAPNAAGGGFAEMVNSAVKSAIDTQQTGEAMSLQAAAGKAELSDVVTAVTNAEVTLQTVVAVRDRVIQAYQDILKMPI